MTFDAWLVFLLAAFLISLSPGPSNLLSLVNGVLHGFRPATAAALGRIAAFAIMIAIAAVGLGAVLATSETAFMLIKWAGVGYLIYLGIQTWRAPATAFQPAQASIRMPAAALARREFLVAAGNPKAILVFTAVFPQFIDPSASYAGQFGVMGPTFLVTELTAASIYALSGRGVGMLNLSVRAARTFNRVTGGVFLGAAALLAFTRRD